MRRDFLLTSLASSTLIMSSSANDAGVENKERRIAPPGNPIPAYRWLQDKYPEEAALESKRDMSNVQAPIMNSPGIALPLGSSDDNRYGESQPPPSGGVTISDVLPSSRQIGIFSGLTRDIALVSKRLEDSSHNSTILAPNNSIMKGLPRKPWEDAKDYETFGENAYAGTAGEDRAHKNLRKFVEAHVVPDSPWQEGAKLQTLGGGTVWWETKDGKKVVSVEQGTFRSKTAAVSAFQIQPGGIEVDTVASKVSNGEVWVLKGIVNYA